MDYEGTEVSAESESPSAFCGCGCGCEVGEKRKSGATMKLLLASGVLALVAASGAYAATTGMVHWGSCCGTCAAASEATPAAQ